MVWFALGHARASHKAGHRPAPRCLPTEGEGVHTLVRQLREILAAVGPRRAAAWQGSY